MVAELTAHSWPEEGENVRVVLGDDQVVLTTAQAVEFGVTLIRLAEHARAMAEKVEVYDLAKEGPGPNYIVTRGDLDELIQEEPELERQSIAEWAKSRGLNWFGIRSNPRQD